MKARLWPSTILVLALALTANLTNLWLSRQSDRPAPYNYRAVLQGNDTAGSTACSYGIAYNYVIHTPGVKVSQAALTAAVRGELHDLLTQAGITNPELKGDAQSLPYNAVARYAGQVPEGIIWQAALRGLMQGVHRSQAGYLTAEDVQAMNHVYQLPFNGIGAVIAPNPNGIRIAAVLPHHPAAAAGIRPYDLITSINGASTAGMSIYQAMDLLRGQVGSRVRLGLRRGSGLESSTWQVVVTRQPLTPDTSVLCRISAGEGHISILWFDNNTAGQLYEAMQRCKQQGVSRVVLDLSQTSAGNFWYGVSACEPLVPAGSLLGEVSTPCGGVRQFRSRCPLQIHLPLVVKVSEHTAGAAELMAAALQHDCAAHVVGQTTAGVGTEQTMRYLPDGSAITLPGARWRMADGTWLQGHGVHPNTSRLSDILEHSL